LPLYRTGASSPVGGAGGTCRDSIEDLVFAVLLDHLFDFGLNQFRAGDDGIDLLVGQIKTGCLFDAGEIQGLDFIEENPRNPPDEERLAVGLSLLSLFTIQKGRS
jgi:hypothetical protein